MTTAPHRLLAVCALASLVAGCASAPPPLPPPTGDPGPALAIAPLEVGFTATDEAPLARAGEPGAGFGWLVCVECEEQVPNTSAPLAPCPDCGGEVFRPAFQKPYRPPVVPREVERRVVEALAARGGFSDVSLLPPPPDGAQPSERRAALLEAARARGAKRLLEVLVEDARVEFREHNGLLGVKVAVFVVCAVAIFPGVDPPNWFLPSEEYAVLQRVRCTLREVPSGRVLSEQVVDTETRDAFAAFGLGSVPSRNWFVVGFLRAPGCLDEDDWRDVSAQLEPRAREDLIRALVLRAEAGRPRDRLSPPVDGVGPK